MKAEQLVDKLLMAERLYCEGNAKSEDVEDATDALLAYISQLEAATHTVAPQTPASERAVSSRQFNVARGAVIDKANERAIFWLVEPDKLTHGERVILNAAADLLAASWAQPEEPRVTLEQVEKLIYSLSGPGATKRELMYIFSRVVHS